MADEAWQLSDDAAEIYETKMVPIALAEWAPRTADAAAVKKGNRVLDTACGTGLVSRECAQRGAKVTGLDLNEGMLKVAGRISPDIDWHLGDVGDLQFEDGAFDASVCQFGLMFLPEPEKAIRELWRVLAPGGRMAVTVWNTIEHMSALPALVRIIEQIVGEEAGQTMRAPFLLGDTGLLTRIFATAGIADVDIETFPGTARFESIDDFV
jgi:ubiquinone/menaquinone biosynthesis C-methylase UbiE